MRQYKKNITKVVVVLMSVLMFTACTDEIKFGNAFLEKAPGGSVTQDTIFGKAVYARQFLTSIYSRQYFGLTIGTANTYQSSASGWTGKTEALTDCWQLYYSSARIYGKYYPGTLTSNDYPAFPYHSEFVWECVRWCYLILENIDRVPDMTEAEKNRIKAEAHCLIATRYFDTFMYYGGIPLVYNSFSTSESTYELPRATAEETVNFIVDQLDQAIAAPELPWAYSPAEAQTETAHWTKASAMALKCRVLLFAASPLFNANQGYYGGNSEAEQAHYVWYGSYKPEYWTRLKTACEEFFAQLNRNGNYSLEQANGTRPEDYRLAFRKAYYDEGSTEILHSVRVAAEKASGWNWPYWVRIGRNSYCPTQEYVEMFPWSDGTPFNWEETEKAGKLDEMFLVGDTASTGVGLLQNVRLTRDPRLYETCMVNGLQKSLNWTTGNMSGDIYELWAKGNDAGDNPTKQSGNFATGYFIMKFTLGMPANKTNIAPDASGHNYQWTMLRLSDVYLMYAEALLQTGDLAGAIKQIDLIRARVGMKGLVECNPSKNLTSDKDALLEELLRERACELGFENIRWMDLVRYKRADIFSKQLHGLLIHKLSYNASTQKWVNDDSKFKGTETKVPQPTHFSYQRYPITNRQRVWWTEGFDPKWYLSPFPVTELNKDYGLVQNPGW